MSDYIIPGNFEWSGDVVFSGSTFEITSANIAMPDLPISPPPGSVIVSYDPVSKRIYQSSMPVSSGWVNVTGLNQLLETGVSYVANNAALVTFDLPILANIGDTFEIKGVGIGGWLIQAGVAQNIELNDLSSSVAGSVSSTNRTDGIKLVCTVANITFSSLYFSGNINFN